MKTRISLLMLIAIPIFGCLQKREKSINNDSSYSFEERTRDLVSRMTLEEKVAQMNSAAPAISRLDVPKFEYHNEALHRISEAPGGVLSRATSFPQSIAMGSTWNPILMKKVFTAVSDEFRAYNNLGEMDPSIWTML